MLHISTFEEIKAGRVTDVYFQRALEVLEAKGVDKQVKAEFVAKDLPVDWQWAVLAGIEECARILEGVDVSVRCMREGTLFRPNQPVMEVQGRYSSFAVLETALLGLLCQASGIATKAARFKKLAGDRIVASFGARRMHPAIAPMIERAAFLGGCDGVSTIVSAELLGDAPLGTMPHALMLVMGSTVEAAKAFHEVMPPEVRRVSLIDTFNDEKFEAINVAEALGDNLFAVRLDTPSSRRGNFYRILEEVRWELDIRGYGHVKLFVSGGITEASVQELNPLVDAYGIGTSISNAPVVDFSMDIVEVDGRPIAKRGKMSGSKSVWRCLQCFRNVTTLCEQRPSHPGCEGEYQEILDPFVEGGKLIVELPNVHDIRSFVLQQIRNLDL